ncbi:MAG: response regulator transcription factor [Patescibacteria group bacterium]
MLAMLLHKPGKRIGSIQRGLRFENMEVESRLWPPAQDFENSLFEANILIMYCQSPDRDILEAVRDLRKKRYTLPIVIIDETENEETKQMSLELGANRYFAKPLSYHMVAMRLKNMIYKRETTEESRWIRGFDVWLDTELRWAKRNNRMIPLRNKEFALLEFFICNRGKVLTRNAILEHVWDRNANFASNTVDVHINRLRRKIDGPFREKLIHTIHCIGYIFDKRKEKQ